jgi:hypothetical protein
MTWTITDTPLPTATAVVPAVLSENIFRPLQGRSLRISLRPLEDGHVTVRVFNVAGEKVRTPFEADLPKDQWALAAWDGKNEDGQTCASGVYLVSVKGGGINRILKVVLMK